MILTMQGRIDRCWLLIHRVPIEEITKLLPQQLSPLMVGEYGFMNTVVSHLSRMRPRGVPAGLGLSYWHVAYRVVLNDGLYFLRSDADSRWIVAAGNAMTPFKFHFAPVRVQGDEITVGGSSPLRLRLGEVQRELMPRSPFTDLESAQRTLKYKPAALYTRGNRVYRLAVSRDEAAWKSRLRSVDEANLTYLEPFNASFEMCFEVEPIEYIWHRAEAA